MTQPDKAQLITADDAASVLGVTTATLRDWVRRGILTRYGSPRRPMYAWTDLAVAQDEAKPRRAGLDVAS